MLMLMQQRCRQLAMLMRLLLENPGMLLLLCKPRVMRRL
jgi:hypothetical protein